MALDKLLFAAKPDGHGSYTFTRSSSASAIDRDGVLQAISTDLLRVEYLDLDGDFVRETPAFLLEAASTNLFTRAGEFDNGDWVKTNMSVVADNGLAADLSTAADLVVPSTLANVHHVQQQNFDVTASVDHTISVYASPAGYNFISLRLLANSTTSFAQAHFALTSSGDVVDTGISNAGILTRTAIDRLRSGQYRCTVVGQISTSTSLDAQIFVSETSSQMSGTFIGSGSSVGLGVELWGAQLEENQGFATSIMESSAAAVARADDTLFFPFTPKPQEMTVYVKFVEGGTKDITNGGLIHIGGVSAGANPRLNLEAVGGVYLARHDNGTANRTSIAAAAPAIGDGVELRLVLHSDGSVTLGQSIEGGTEAVAARSAATPLGVSWNDTRLYINSRGSGAQGFSSIIAVKLVVGVKTMAEMRSLDPFFSVGGITVPVVQDGASADRQEVGDRSRTFDGTLRETIRSRVNVWDAETVPMARQDAEDVQAVLESSTQPQTSFGDMVAGSTGDFPLVFTRLTAKTPVQSGNERRYVFAFTAEESS